MSAEVNAVERRPPGTEPLTDPARIAAAEQAARLLVRAGVSLDALCGMAAHLTAAPMASLAVVGAEQEQRLGSHGLPPSLAEKDVCPLAASVGSYVVGDHPLACAGDLRHDADRDLREHPLVGHGLNAFMAVPVRDGRDRPVAALAVFDTRARHWSEEDAVALNEIAGLLAASVWPAGRGTRPATTLDGPALLDGVPDAFLAVDPAGRIRGFNRAAREMLGYSATQVIGRPLDDTLDPEHAGEPIAAALDRLFTARPARPVRREVTVRHRDGHRITAYACLSIVHGTAGPLAAVLLTGHTAQATAEETAERHTALLTTLLDILQAGVAACDDTGRVIMINRALRQVHQLTESGPVSDQMLPTSMPTSLFDASMRPLSWDQVPLMRAWRGECLVDDEVLVQMPEQRLRAFSTTAQPLVGRDGRHLGAVAVAHETTALRQTERFRTCHHEVEKALRATNSITEAAPAVLRAVAEALGWPCAELFLIDEGDGALRAVGHHSCSGIDPDGFFDHTPVRGLGVTGRVWETGRPLWVPDIGQYPDIRTDYERQRADMCVRSGIRTVLAVPVRDGGTLLGVLTCYAGSPEVHEDLHIVLLDGIAAQIGVYVALRRAEELARQLTRTQDDFLDLIGHELRTPLTSITANAAMLAEESGGLGEEQRQMLGTLVRNTAALQHIVDALLDMSALETGHHRLTIGRLDLAGIVGDAVHRARLAAGGAGVRLRTTVPEPVWVHGDADRLRQVLDDLLSNAVRYSPAGAEVHVSLHARATHAEIRVADTGIGTPAAERGRVFDRFFRAGNVRHHGAPGSGLGLSLARTIVRRHHGTITLDANQPTGTVVSVRLPLTATTATTGTTGTTGTGDGTAGG